MVKKSAAEKKIDRRIEQLYYKHCSGMQINIMDIGKVFKAGQAWIAAKSGIDDAELGNNIKAYVEILARKG